MPTSFLASHAIERSGGIWRPESIWHTVKELDKRDMEEQLKQADKSTPRVIGIISNFLPTRRPDKPKPIGRGLYGILKAGLLSMVGVFAAPTATAGGGRDHSSDGALLVRASAELK
jgi:hypothetical protein